MELEGRLNSTISLPEIIQFLGINRMTGTFTVVGGDQHAVSLDLKQGKLVGSISLNRSRRLGQILLNWGLADRQTIKDSIEYQKQFSPGTPLGRILVQREVITGDVLKKAVKLQLEEEFWELFSLETGSFKFEHKNDVEVGKDFLIELDIEPLIIEGTRRLDEWTDIRKNIPSEKHVPHVVPFHDSSEREMIHLSEKEWNVLSLINGRYNMECLTLRSGLGRFETFRITNGLIANGLVRLTLDKDALPISLEFGDFNEREPSDHSFKSDPHMISLKALDTQTPTGEAEIIYPTAVSYLAAISTTALGHLTQDSSFIIDQRDEKIAELYWNEILMAYPRADLIVTSGNTVSSDNFDRYTRELGIDGVLRSVYLETLDALIRFIRTIYLISAQRLGTKNSRSIFTGILVRSKENSRIDNTANFSFAEFVARVLESE